jgi:hypothetical protein
MNIKAILRCTAAVTMLLPALAHATTINGTLAIGSLNIVIISAPGGVGNLQFTANGNGDMFTVNASTGTFLAPSQVPDAGKITAAINQGTEPVNTTFGPVTGWLTIDSTTLSFDLNEVLGGGFSSANCASGGANATCTPAGSPFNLVNNSTDTGSTASFQVNGIFNDGTVGDSVAYTGLFQTTFSNMTYEQLLSQISGGTPVDTSWSATFSAVSTPEPTTFVLFLAGTGLIGLGSLRRKKVS